MAKLLTKYLFGPISPEKLGISYRMDIVPLKTCTQNCIYCPLKSDTHHDPQRKPNFPIDAFLSELKTRVTEGLQSDYIILSGFGEPTINSQIGDLIDGIKNITDIPVALITNSSLLTDPNVRADCAKADILLPSIDAGDDKTFKKINRPKIDTNLEQIVKGICELKNNFKGQIWLRIFFVNNINTSNEQIQKIKTIINRVNPDKVLLNTNIRAAAPPAVISEKKAKLKAIAKKFCDQAQIVEDYANKPRAQIKTWLQKPTPSKSMERQ